MSGARGNTQVHIRVEDSNGVIGKIVHKEFLIAGTVIIAVNGFMDESLFTFTYV